MKKFLTIALFLFFSIFLFAQEQEHLYFLETDTSWRKELFLFPINFAPDIKYQGVEDARFPVGWEKQDSPNFWSYVFAWNIEHSDVITENDLEADLQKYFNGLMRWDQTSVEILKTTAQNNITNYQGSVNTTDAFFTKKPMTLNVKVEKTYCEQKKKSIIRFQFSPKQFGHSVWQKLEEVQLPASIAACQETKIKKIHDLISACTEYGQFNGTALIAEQGKIIYKNGFGEANKEWAIPNKADTKHRLASISKQFTAMAVLQLVAKGKLELKVPITNYLPDYPQKTGNQITIHHLLTHTSGLPNYTSFPNYRDLMRNPQSTEDLVNLFAELPLDFTPGKDFAYSNSGYVLLGVLIEKATGKTYEEVLQEQIFTPLKMDNTGYDKQQTILKNRASGYNKFANSYENTNYIDMSMAYAAGALYSTVEDLYLWDQALYTETLLPKAYGDQLFEKHIPAWAGFYGYGWEIGKMPIGNSKKQASTISHGGSINGFNTRITRIPSDRSLIVLFNNTGEAPLYDMTAAIIGILNDHPYTSPKRSLAYTLLAAIEKDKNTDLHAFYNKIKDSDDYHLNENQMNMSGYQLLQAGNVKAAAVIFKINTEAFPNSFNTFDSYGEALMVLGDTTQAIENYKKSVQLNPNNENGIKILKGLDIDTNSLITKVPLEHLKLLAGEYKALDQGRDWTIIIEEKDGNLFGNDGGYRYSLNPVGNDRFINPDDGATLVFDTKDKTAISFIIFGRVKFEKVH